MIFEARHLDYGDPIEYNQGWWDARENDNILYVTYEETKRDIHDVIRKAASFLNKSVNDGTVDRIAEATSISVMRKTPYLNIGLAMKQLEEGGMIANQFYRKGVWLDFGSYTLLPSRRLSAGKIEENQCTLWITGSSKYKA